VTILDRLAADHDVGVSARAVLGLIRGDDEGRSRAFALWPALVPEVRRRVKTEMTDVIPQLETTIASALEPGSREVAVRLLAAVDATAHAERIARALDDPDGRVRLAAVQALITLEPEQVGDWLKRVSNDPVAEVRAAARRGPWRVV